MAIGHYTLANLQEGGLDDVYDLDMGDKDFLKQLKDNLKCPGGQINVGSAMIATPAFKFGAKVHMRLEAASNIVQFYKTVGKDITNTMIQ